MNFKMKPIKIILFLALFFSTVLKTNAQPLKSRPHVIVELFTAEGCSSCPAADELLKEMPDILNKENKNVIGLSFHVTYWNKSGWEDPYSNELFTDRQKKYVAKLNLPQLYTPQAIVNGEKEFIGSNPLAFRDLVTAASEKNAAYEITAQTANENDKVLVNYELNRDPKNIVMNIAIVEKDVVHYIPRGENKGRTLKHTNVVRAFETIDPQRKGNYSIIWPTNLEKTNSRIILYAQNIKTMKITGSTIIDQK
jgi:hypothetical protein